MSVRARFRGSQRDSKTHPTPRRATMFIKKLEAARRQLDAAIRMTFANEDELAIHTVAAAAYRVVRDLLEKRGRFDLDETITVGAYLTACSLAAGELPQAELDDLTRESPKLRDLIAAIADEIKAKGDAITPSIHLDRSLRIADWSRLSAAANFLKHADKDAETHLSLNKINNDEILVRAISAYVSIFRQPSDILHQRPYILHQTPAMSAFHIWWMSRHDPDQLRQEYGAEFADVFQRLSPSRRRRACLKLIRLFTRERSESHAPLVVLSR
jgi:hypothetical protein